MNHTCHSTSTRLLALSFVGHFVALTGWCLSPCPGPQALLSGRGANATSYESFFSSVFLSPPTELVVLGCQVDKAHLTLICAWRGQFEKGASADGMILVYLLWKPFHKHIFFSKHQWHQFYFSPEDYPAINDSFVFQDILGRDFVSLTVIC